MKNAYLFAIEFDHWGGLISNELNQIPEDNSLNELLMRLKTHLGLLAVYITGAYTEAEKILIDQIIADCQTLKLFHATTLSNNQTTYPKMSQQLQNLIQIYQMEKQNSFNEENIDDTITRFNKMTENAANFFKKS